MSVDKPYQNKVWFQGTIVSNPSVMTMSSGKKSATFQLCHVESWVDTDGTQKQRRNVIPVETLGRAAEYVLEHATLGVWATVDGYLRSELAKGQTIIRIRAYSITIWRMDGSSSTSPSG